MQGQGVLAAGGCEENGEGCRSLAINKPNRPNRPNKPNNRPAVGWGRALDVEGGYLVLEVGEVLEEDGAGVLAGEVVDEDAWLGAPGVTGAKDGLGFVTAADSLYWPDYVELEGGERAAEECFEVAGQRGKGGSALAGL